MSALTLKHRKHLPTGGAAGSPTQDSSPDVSKMETCGGFGWGISRVWRRETVEITRGPDGAWDKQWPFLHAWILEHVLLREEERRTTALPLRRAHSS